MKNSPDFKSQFKDRLLRGLREAEIPVFGQGTWLAAVTGVTDKATSKWLNGESLPYRDKWPVIARALGQPDDYFFRLDAGAGVSEAQDERITQKAVSREDFRVLKQEQELVSGFRKLSQGGKYAALTALHKELEASRTEKT